MPGGYKEDIVKTWLLRGELLVINNDISFMFFISTRVSIVSVAAQTPYLLMLSSRSSNQTDSTCLEEIKKMPLKAGGALAAVSFPTLPGFLSANVTKVLIEKFGIAGISDADIELFMK